MSTLESIFHLDVSGWSIVLRTVIVYLALLFGLRLAGKRELGQMSTPDLVVIILIANAVQNAMVGPDTSVTGGLIAATVLVGLNHAVTLARLHIPWLRRVTGSSPTLLINDGQIIDANLRKEDVDVDDVLMAIREHGFSNPTEVQMAVLEADGSISVVPKGDATQRTRRKVKYLKKGE